MARSLPTAVIGTLLLVFSVSGADTDSSKRRVLFFSKSSGFEHAVIKRHGEQPSFVERLLRELEQTNNLTFTFSKDGSKFTSEYLGQFDAFFFYTTGDLTKPGTDKEPPMTAAGKSAFLNAIRSGKGFIGVHSATDTFHSPGNEDKNSAQRYKDDGANLDPYIAMLGGEFIKHGSQQKSRMIVADPKFPGMAAVPQDFAPLEEWYSLKNFATNLHVLLVQDTSRMTGNMYQRAAYPAAWARMHGEGRVFYTNMGHREDVWTNSVFQSLLLGGIKWATRQADAAVEPTLGQTTPNAGDLPPAR